LKAKDNKRATSREIVNFLFGEFPQLKDSWKGNRKTTLLPYIYSNSSNDKITRLRRGEYQLI
jgi:hypothetical protein